MTPVALTTIRADNKSERVGNTQNQGGWQETILTQGGEGGRKDGGIEITGRIMRKIFTADGMVDCSTSFE